MKNEQTNKKRKHKQFYIYVSISYFRLVILIVIYVVFQFGNILKIKKQKKKTRTLLNGPFEIDLWMLLLMKRLHGVGARKVVVVGVGPLGCIPFVRTLQFAPNDECSEEVNQLIEAYNFRLSEVVDQLNQEFNPKTMFVYANSYAVFMQIIDNYQQYGQISQTPYFTWLFFPFWVKILEGFS